MMNWIKTADRLPECDSDGCSDELIICVDGEVFTGIRYWCGFKIFVDEMDADYQLDEVSHWMPLPEPPEDLV
jgi:hypothetical protein